MIKPFQLKFSKKKNNEMFGFIILVYIYMNIYKDYNMFYIWEWEWDLRNNNEQEEEKRVTFIINCLCIIIGK